jgi:hypothetical protein
MENKDIVISIQTSAPQDAPPLRCAYNDYAPHIPYSVSSLSTPAAPSGFLAWNQPMRCAWNQLTMCIRWWRSSTLKRTTTRSCRRRRGSTRSPSCNTTRRRQARRTRRCGGATASATSSSTRCRPQQPANGVSPESKISLSKTGMWCL